MEMGQTNEEDEIKRMDWSSDEEDNRPFGGNDDNA
jgi:hypothetical protein